jgi:hypothetical protein
VAHWDGFSWSFDNQSISGLGAALSSVTCIADQVCWAVGYENLPNFGPYAPYYDSFFGSYGPVTLIEQFTSNLQVTSAFRSSDGHFHLAGLTLPGAPIDIQSAPDFASPFTTLTTVTADSAGAFHYDDDVFNVSTRAYRAAAHY